MIFKSAIVAMSPNGDPKKDRAVIKTADSELTVIVVKKDSYQAIEVCKELVQKEGIRSLILCPGFTYQDVAKVVDTVGERVPVCVARGDFPNTLRVKDVLEEAGWF
jgi:hypothetical protein